MAAAAEDEASRGDVGKLGIPGLGEVRGEGDGVGGEGGGVGCARGCC